MTTRVLGLLLCLIGAACGGAKNDASSQCKVGCAYLTGGCEGPGTACICEERGTMVCQKDLRWELILDTTGCPDKQASYEGLGCLGANATCDDPGDVACTCDAASSVYRCSSADM